MLIQRIIIFTTPLSDTMANPNFNPFKKSAPHAPPPCIPCSHNKAIGLLGTHTTWRDPLSINGVENVGFTGYVLSVEDVHEGSYAKVEVSLSVDCESGSHNVGPVRLFGAKGSNVSHRFDVPFVVRRPIRAYLEINILGKNLGTAGDATVTINYARWDGEGSMPKADTESIVREEVASVVEAEVARRVREEVERRVGEEIGNVVNRAWGND